MSRISGPGAVRVVAAVLMVASLLVGVLPASAQQQKTVVFWHMPNGADPAAAIATEIVEFNRIHPDITIQPQQISWAEAFLRIQTAVQGGEGPCVTQLGTTWVPGFSAMGGLRPYTPDEVAAFGGQLAFPQAAWDTRGIAGDNTMYAVPWFSDVRAVGYRTDVLNAAGVNPSVAFTSMESFLGALTKIRDSGLGVDPIVHTGRNDWNVWQNAGMFMWAFGGDFLTPDATRAAINSPQAVDGITFYYGLYGHGVTPMDTLELNSAQTDERFGQGRAAMTITGPWIISNARAPIDQGGWTSMEARQNLAFAPFPTGPAGQYAFIGGSNLAVLKSCQNVDAANEWVKFLLSKDSQIRYGQAIGMLPATLTAQNDPIFTADPLYSVFIQSAQHGKASPAIPVWGSLEPALLEGLQGLWDDVASGSRANPISRNVVQTRMDATARALDNLLR